MDEVDSPAGWLAGDGETGSRVWPRGSLSASLPLSLSHIPAISTATAASTSSLQLPEPVMASHMQAHSGLQFDHVQSSRHYRHMSRISPSGSSDAGLTDSITLSDTDSPLSPRLLCLPGPLLSLSTDSASLLDSLSSCSTSISIASQDSGFDEVDARLQLLPTSTATELDREQPVLSKQYPQDTGISRTTSRSLPVKIESYSDRSNSNKGENSCETGLSPKGNYSMERHQSSHIETSSKGNYSTRTSTSTVRGHMEYRERSSHMTSTQGMGPACNLIRPAELAFILKNGMEKVGFYI